MKILHTADWHLDAPMAGLGEENAQELRRQMRKLPEKITRLCMAENCDLLIIDDLGTEFSTNYTTTQIYNIFNSRILRSKPVIINTNLTIKELEEAYSQRFVSRIMGNCDKLDFYGKDIRPRKA